MSHKGISEVGLTKRIYEIRGQRVLLDRDLAELYGVSTGALNRAVKRNVERFPEDFMLQPSREEWVNLKCQIGISSYGGDRALPYAFTEQGVAMLSGVLHSPRAIQVNIAIMRAFVKMRQVFSETTALAAKVQLVEEKVGGHDRKIQAIFRAIRKPPYQPVEID